MKLHVVKLKIRALEPENWHIFVTGKIDGQKVNLVVDTGASHSCFDTGFISQLYNNENFEDSEGMNAGIGSNDLQAKITTLNKLQIGHLTLKNYTAVLLDLSHVNRVYEMAKKPLIQGIIGSDLLKKYGAVIDFKRGIMTLEYE